MKKRGRERESKEKKMEKKVYLDANFVNLLKGTQA
jgi:hypothetical protein